MSIHERVNRTRNQFEDSSFNSNKIRSKADFNPEIQITGKLKEAELNPSHLALPDKTKDKTIPEYKQTIIKEDLSETGEVFSLKLLMRGFLF